MTQHGRALAIVTNYGVEQDELLVPVRHLRENGVHVDIAAPTRADEPLVTDDAGNWRLVTSRNPGDLEHFLRGVDAALRTRPGPLARAERGPRATTVWLRGSRGHAGAMETRPTEAGASPHRRADPRNRQGQRTERPPCTTTKTYWSS
ncbi:hypothetical protein ACFU7Z_30830 [Kitasatospora sp. NPDC057518]|uniref:hypothetical protein n=1 Tax=Kitasatospora sp. NPDC057518 TaxID=3346155 RepID=UPI00369D214F